MFKVVDNEFNRANYPSLIGNIYYDNEIPSYAAVLPASNCKYDKSITHVVQAWMSGMGWVDCRPATSKEDAEQQEAELKADISSWMPDDTGRRTRIVIAQ